jgi:hypothetical protein
VFGGSIVWALVPVHALKEVYETKSYRKFIESGGDTGSNTKMFLLGLASFLDLAYTITEEYDK